MKYKMTIVIIAIIFLVLFGGTVFMTINGSGFFNIGEIKTNKTLGNAQEQLDEIEGNPNIEVEQARVEADGTVNETLKARLDKKENEFNSQLAYIEKNQNQIDFVDFIKNHSRYYSNMIFSRTSTNTFQVRLNNNDKGAVYQFVKDTNDDFIKLDSCGVGISDVMLASINPTAGNTADAIFANGTFAASGSNFYTTTVGNSIQTEVEGSKITIFAYTESRGGIWEYVIDGHIKGQVSVYNETGVNKILVLAENLEPVKHKLVLTFKGDDPVNPPSSYPSRGYLTRTADINNGMIVGRVISGALTTEILASGSNKEFAFNVTKDGSTNWIPEHDAIGSTFANVEAFFSLDGVSRSVSELEIGKLYKINSFELVQDVNGKVVGVGDVVNIKSSHKITKDGILSYGGNFKALSDFTINSGYPMMLPSLTANAKDFISPLMNIKTNAGDESTYYFAEEKNKSISGAVIDSTNRNLIGAVTMKNADKMYRKGKTGITDAEKSLFLWQRATKPKMYWQSFNNASIVTGDVYGWAFNLAVADIGDIYDLVRD